MELAGGAPYRTMYRDMFPLLRQVRYKIEYATVE
jgi:hypothetical protein